MPARLIPQRKRPASADQPRRSRRKALFAKQMPYDHRSSRTSTEKSCFCKTNAQRPAIKTSDHRKKLFLQNKRPAAIVGTKACPYLDTGLAAPVQSAGLVIPAKAGIQRGGGVGTERNPMDEGRVRQ